MPIAHFPSTICGSLQSFKLPVRAGASYAQETRLISEMEAFPPSIWERNKNERQVNRGGNRSASAGYRIKPSGLIGRHHGVSLGFVIQGNRRFARNGVMKRHVPVFSMIPGLGLEIETETASWRRLAQPSVCNGPHMPTIRFQIACLCLQKS